MKKDKCKKAFTLAEVLITIGIIGVVAALTLPTLIQNHRKTEVASRLKKFYSVMNQALELSKIEYGDFENWDLPPRGTILPVDETVELFQKYIGKNLKYSKLEKKETEFTVYLDDGSSFTLANKISDIAYKPGKKYTAYMFRFAPKDTDLRDKYHRGKGVEPYTWDWDGTVEGLKNPDKGAYSCTENGGAYCTKLIQMNGWEIPKDYPRKL